MSEAGMYRNGIAVVAGGSGGLGGAICELLAERGNDIALTYHKNRARAEEVAGKVREHGRRALIAQVALEDEPSVIAFVDKVRKEWGPPGTVVYAAGPLLSFGYISKVPSSEFRNAIEQDVFGFYNLVQETLPSLRETKGALVSLATPALQRYARTDILSIAPKAAIHSVIRGIASEEGRFGVRANSVGVGLVGDAGLIESLTERGHVNEKFLKATYEWVSLHRLGRAKEVAEVVSFLASERASFVTGQLVNCDGGLAI